MSTEGGFPLTYHNVDRLCGSVDLTIPEPVINMSRVTFIEPFALIYLGMFINYHNGNGRYFKVVAPSSKRTREYLSSQNFWQRCNIRTDERLDAPGTVAQLTSFNDIVYIERNHDAAEEIADRVFRLLSGNSYRLDVWLTAELVEELVDNIVRHSESPTAACVVQHYPKSNRLDFAIGDCGIGIRRSLSKNVLYSYIESRSHSEAASLAFQETVGRGAEGGMGLSTVRENVVQMKGSMFLSTGDGWVLVSRRGDEVGNQSYDLPGVQIEVSIPLTT